MHPDGKPRSRSARSGAERQRDYRAKRNLASIDISGEVAEKLRLLRDKTRTTTDAVLSRALEALWELLAREASVDQPASTDKRDKRKPRANPTHPARKSSPGDVLNTKKAEPAKDPTAAADQGTRTRGKKPKDVRTKAQGQLDI